MPTNYPTFNITAPSETTRFYNLGKELREFGASVDAALKSFNYNGADPNLLLSRVAALETWKNAAQARLNALETVATLDNSTIVKPTAVTINSATELRKRGDGQVSGYLLLNITRDFVNGETLATLPAGWRPVGTREHIAYASTGGSAVTVLMQVLNTGGLRIWSGPTSWNGNRNMSVNLNFFAAN